MSTACLSLLFLSLVIFVGALAIHAYVKPIECKPVRHVDKERFG